MEMIKIKKIRFGILIVVAILMLVSGASALPSWINAYVTHPGIVGPSYFDIKVTSNGDNDIKDGVTYVGWCADSQNYIYPPATLNFTVYSSLNTVPYPPVPTANWNKINYVLNNPMGADKDTLEAVFWHYDGRVTPIEPYNHAKYAALVAAADGNATFVPDCGQKYAVVLYHETGTFENPVQRSHPTQAIFLVLTKPMCSDPGIPVPEFPTLALPAGMIIGLMGLVYVIREREI